MSTQTLRCEFGHQWSRETVTGRTPKACPDHADERRQNLPPSPSNTAEAKRKRHHQGSEVTAAEVVQWASSLGFEAHPRLKGKVADILIDRYNREHPDRPYVRGVA